MMDINLLIDDRDVAASTGATFERRDPITGDVASRAAAASVADAQAAADALRLRFRPGPSSDPTPGAQSSSGPRIFSKGGLRSLSHSWRPRLEPPPAGRSST